MSSEVLTVKVITVFAAAFGANVTPTSPKQRVVKARAGATDPPTVIVILSYVVPVDAVTAAQPTGIFVLLVSCEVAMFPVHAKAVASPAPIGPPIVIVSVSYDEPLDAETTVLVTITDALFAVAVHVVPLPAAANSALLEVMVTVSPDVKAAAVSGVAVNVYVLAEYATAAP